MITIKLVMMNGGLGNQIFQYVFMRYIELMTKEECIIDDTAFFSYTEAEINNPVHNGFQLERIFSLKPKRLSKMLDHDVYEKLLTLSAITDEEGNPQGIVPVFRDMGVDLKVLEEGLFYQMTHNGFSGFLHSFMPPNEWYQDITDFDGDVYYYGYWINYKWFAENTDVILKELTFPQIKDDANKAYMDMIKAAGTHSVAVHIRRGDFVTVGWVTHPKRYAEMIDYIRTNIDKPVFFVFSDDMNWCRENLVACGFKETDSIVFVEGNFRENSYIDMQLMKECRGMVFSTSSFSYLASLLNTRRDKIAVHDSVRTVIYYK